MKNKTVLHTHSFFINEKEITFQLFKPSGTREWKFRYVADEVKFGAWKRTGTGNVEDAKLRAISYIRNHIAANEMEKNNKLKKIIQQIHEQDLKNLLKVGKEVDRLITPYLSTHIFKTCSEYKLSPVEVSLVNLLILKKKIKKLQEQERCSEEKYNASKGSREVQEEKCQLIAEEITNLCDVTKITNNF